ncbi:uncharacterized protein LOC136040606 isoform X3 [Artemia franciscana]|uniref:uncharacterized protein LOC136040606 isoform X3 n=1 Tax=Artemia franciscana TaxID=6661 RepID=UPI0032DB02DE
MDGYQGDVEGTGTQNTPVRLHPKKSKSGPSSEMETSGIFSDVELVNDDPESSKNRTVIRTAPQSDKSKLVSKTPSSRSSASSSLCSVATKISAKSPRLQNTKDIKDAANRSRKLPLPQTKVPLRKSTMPEIKPPTKARSISLSTKPPAAQLIPPVIPPRESPSRISYQRPPKPAPKPAKSIESEKLPNRRPGPYANGRQSMLPSARQGKSIVPVANSTPEGDAATGRLRRKTVFALGNTRKSKWL